MSTIEIGKRYNLILHRNENEGSTSSSSVSEFATFQFNLKPTSIDSLSRSGEVIYTKSGEAEVSLPTIDHGEEKFLGKRVDQKMSSYYLLVVRKIVY